MTVRITICGWKPSTRTEGFGSNVETDDRGELSTLGTVPVAFGRIGGGSSVGGARRARIAISIGQVDGSHERS